MKEERSVNSFVRASLNRGLERTDELRLLRADRYSLPEVRELNGKLIEKQSGELLLPRFFSPSGGPLNVLEDFFASSSKSWIVVLAVVSEVGLARWARSV